MSQRIVHTCDRCRREGHSEDAELLPIQWGRLLVSYGAPDFDLCDNCVAEAMRALGLNRVIPPGETR